MPPFISSSWLSFMICLWIYSCLYMHSVSCQYLDDQKSLLLELKNNLKFNSEALDKLEGWNHSTNYCQWSGVECDNSNNGRVIGLDLSNKNIIGGIDNTSSLFRLQFLQSLNLGGENEIQGEIPSAIGKLSSLTYLNYSQNYIGQVPIEISNLVKLVVLDISTSFGTYMNRPNLADIIRNLTNIRELYLDQVNNSAIGNQWCQTLASSLPHLQVLSMSYCHLEGEIHNSLSRLHRLSVIHLDSNSLVGPVPQFLTRLTNLTKLSLSYNDLTGIVPHKIFQVPTLRTLDLSYNLNLEGTLPVFYTNGSLEELCLGDTKFSRVLPSSISNLKSLRTINLRYCQFNGSLPSSIGNLNLLQSLVLTFNQFSGSIPSSIGSLNILEDLELNDNQFSGHIPSFSSLKKLKTLFLRNNSLVGSITGENWEKLLNLELLSLSSNSLDGNIPMSLFSLPSLEVLDLENNKFSGQLNESANPAFSKLTEVYLNNNNFEGPIPKSIFHLRQLEWLDLSSNSFNGTLKLAEILLSLKNLTSLNLSFNRLSVVIDVDVNSSFPLLQELHLGSCNLHNIPDFLKNQVSITTLDLSKNHIAGLVPRWVWGINYLLNLSSNHLVELEPPLATTLSNASISTHLDLDLHSNKLQGTFSIALPNLEYLDCSNNNFTSIDPHSINYLSKINFLSFSRNNLYGTIPKTLCNATNLHFLNLEYNHLSGTIPDCLFAKTTLSVLNLRGNNLGGSVPAEFGKNCTLQTLNLNENHLQGQIPRSLGYCKALKVLDLGNNQLNDTFPCHLISLSSLQVLVLRSNKLHGAIVCPESRSIWPLLQIMDVASNHFIGDLNSQILFKWTLMMIGTNKEQSKTSFLQSSISPNGGYYQNSVSVTLKGNTYELQYILSIFTSIDISNNAFHGELPKELGNLNGLVVLNLSHNSFLGHIPSSFGNLSQIESLDLSSNALTGRIPTEFVNLNFLSYLNLSFNKLSGKIPTGTQLQSFNASSYEGNQGLFGSPLTTHDPITVTPPTSSEGSNWSSKSEREWMLRGAEVGFPVGITIFVGPILYIKRYREWYCKHLHIVIMKILRKEDNITRARRRRRRRNQQRQRR